MIEEVRQVRGSHFPSVLWHEGCHLLDKICLEVKDRDEEIVALQVWL